ncbi:rhamnogalacturonan acetylesterase [Arachidicoccus sp.]|uniref:rhamnogalacturonan acetylesterase n=1 Tax=Arachidicoccus sp. TaxID=1872624 RepID=UPI003D220BA6
MKLKFPAFLLVILLLSFSFVGQKKKIRIFMAGDSTMQNYNIAKTPQRGWGQMLPDFFNKNVVIFNEARGGRSTKSFIKEGLWQKLIDSVRAEDWVFIEFGHNDQDKRKPERFTPPQDYKINLERMVRDVLAKGAHPVLLTPIAMRSFKPDGRYYDGHGDYPEKVREVAQAFKIPIIDLDKTYGEVISELGPEKSKDLFMNFDANIYPAFPKGDKDNTHQREAGAREIAKLAVQGIRENNIKTLIENLK